ncbi:MAG: alpha/beta fold hydrolase, partial [Acidimicrobiia bacterium]
MLNSFAGGAVFGERFGDGPLQVLALHGWGRDRRDFDEVLQGLDAAALDLPGFGASPAPVEAMGAAGYAGL